jgi:3-oxoacyl-[acyl-carrier-protein] synthase II
MNSPQTRVLITGLGVISSLGRTAAFWDALTSGGGRDIEAGDVQPSAIVADYSPPANLDAEAASRLGRCSLFAVDAAIQAVEDARLPFTAQTAPLIGVLFGSELGESERPVAGAPATSVARVLGVAGPVHSYAGPAAGALAVAQAFEIVRRGEAPVVVAGGADIPAGLYFDAGSRRPRPFDADRDGFLPAEAAAAVVLESAEVAEERGARVYGELLGQGSAFSRATVMEPGPNFVDAARAMRAALLRAEIFQGEVEVVFASASGDPAGDAIEVRALKDLWGPNVDRLTVTSLLGASGYPFAAAGPLALVAGLRALAAAVVPPTVGLVEPDPDFTRVDFVIAEPRKYRWSTGLVNTVGAGLNVSLVLRTHA